MRPSSFLSSVLGFWIAVCGSGCDHSALPRSDGISDLSATATDAHGKSDSSGMVDASSTECLVPYCESNGQGPQTVCRPGFMPPIGDPYALPVPCGADSRGNWCSPMQRPDCQDGCCTFCDVTGYRAV